MIPVQPYLPWKIGMTVLHIFSISLTCLRLECRRRSGKLWWDDWTAIPPTVINIVNTVALWLRLRYGPQPREHRVLYSYLSSFCFSTIIWWSRISLALAVVRITPLFSRLRRISIGMTVTFIFIWISLLTTMIARCALSTEWQRSSSPVLICGPAYWVTVASLSCDIIGDIFLVGIPLYQLWNISLPPEERLRVRLVFSTSLLTFLSVIGLFIFSYGGIAQGPGRLIVWLMVCHIEEAVSLIVCNLLVLICWVHRYITPQKGNDEDEVEDKRNIPDKNVKPETVDTLDEILNICSAESTGLTESMNEQAHSATHSSESSV